MNTAISDLQLHCCCTYTNFYLIILCKISQRLRTAKSFRHKTTDKCEANSGKRVHSEPCYLMGLPYLCNLTFCVPSPCTNFFKWIMIWFSLLCFIQVVSNILSWRKKIQLLTLHKPKNHTMCLRALSKHFLSSVTAVVLLPIPLTGIL